MIPAGRLFHRNARVTTWRESVPSNPQKFVTQRSPNATIIEDLRIQFTIQKSLRKHPNTCDIYITNLNPVSQADMERKPLYVELAAGYDGVTHMLFTGDLRYAQSELKGTDYETLLMLGDGDCMHAWARVNRSYPVGTSVRRILADCAASMGFQLPKNLADDRRLDAAVNTGHSMFGPTRDELTTLLREFGYTWSIQNNTLQILGEDQVRPDQALFVDEEHGMIGTPKYGTPPRSGKPPHMTVQTLLYPTINPGSLIKLTSRPKSGLFRAEKVKHHGDNMGGPWTTELEIKPVTGEF